MGISDRYRRRSLAYNGATDPGRWRPESGQDTFVPRQGSLIGYRYGGWRVVECRPVEEYDWSDQDHADMKPLMNGVHAKNRDQQYQRHRPHIVVIQHESGPYLPGQASVWRGRQIHFRTRPSWNARWHVLPERHQMCSCHGHIWPCQDADMDDLAEVEQQRMEKILATAAPGVCAHCGEQVTDRHRKLTFPEPSLLVPGAPGPTFHAGRTACWGAAEKYERDGRLAADPNVARLASCPGIQFIHEKRDIPIDKRIECTAGKSCTGLHGPAGYRREKSCDAQVQIPGHKDQYVQPSWDCGYRGAFGPCSGSYPPGPDVGDRIADLVWTAGYSL